MIKIYYAHTHDTVRDTVRTTECFQDSDLHHHPLGSNLEICILWLPVKITPGTVGRLAIKITQEYMFGVDVLETGVVPDEGMLLILIIRMVKNNYYYCHLSLNRK